MQFDPFSIAFLLHRKGCSFFDWAAYSKAQSKSAFKRAIDNHMLGAIIPKDPKDKELVYNLRSRRCHLPQIKTERYKKTFVKRLIFKYNLV